jgi:predicted RND superfamily exporter protein
MNEEPLSLSRRLLRIGADHPLPSLMFLLAVSMVAVLGLLRVTIDTGFEQLLPRDGADRQAYLQVAREFGSDNRSFIYLRDEQLWTPEKLAALERLHEDLRQLPFVERIDDLFTAPTVKNVEGQLYAQPLLTAAPTDEQGAESARRTVLADPLALRNVVGADGKTLAIGIAVRESHEGVGGIEANAMLERVLASARVQFPALVHVGPSRIEAEIHQSLERDVLVLVPALALTLVVVTFLFCRSVFAAVMPLLVGALSLLWTLGMMGLAGIPVTLLSMLLPLLVVVVATTKTMRMISGYAHSLPPQAQRNALPDRKLLTEFMIRNLGMPVVLTALTMTLGFALNAFADIMLIRNFGLVAAFAILSSGLLTLLLIPALSAAFGPHHRLPRFALSGWFSAHAARTIGVLRHRLTLWVFALGAVLYAVFVQQAASLYVTSEPMGFFRPDHPLVQASVRMHEELAGMKVFYITLDANAEGAFRDPANLQRLADIQAFITKQQIFDRSLSLADIVSQASQEAGGGRPEAYHVPSSRKLVSQYLLLHPPQVLEPYVSHDLRRANIVVRHNVRESSTLNHHIRELRQAVANYAGPNMVTAVVGENLLINAAADRLLKSQAVAFIALVFAVLIVMALMFTSVKGGVIALVPSVVPMLIVFGGMRILEIPVSAGSVMVAVIISGIAIEGTIHLFSRYSELCRNTSDYDEAVVETVKQEAAPMVAISMTLAAGCGVLTFSEFAPIAQFGALTAAALLSSIFANLLITPLVMSRIRLVGLYEILAMSMQREALVASPLFQGMTSYQIRKTILISELREYRDGERLIEQGSMGRSMYLVVDGQLEALRREGDGARRRALFGPGDVFGEIGFVHETYRTAEVRALGPVSVLRFDHGRLKKDLAFFPYIMAKLNFNISGILGRRLAEVVEEYQPPPPSATAGAVKGQEGG